MLFTMSLGIHKDALGGDKHIRKEVIPHALRTIRTYITSLFFLIPSSQIHSEDRTTGQQAKIVSAYEEAGFPTETADKMVAFETIFKNGIQNTLVGLDDLNQIPVGGKIIEYYRNMGDVSGKKLTPESIKTLNLPDKFDISPKNIPTPISDIIFSLGHRKFKIMLPVGNFKSMYMTDTELIIHTTVFFDRVYSKDVELPNLLWRLWTAQEGKGVKDGFGLVTVEEI